MYLEEILPELRAGKKFYRPSLSDVKWVAFADPRKYPELDGERQAYQIRYRTTSDMEVDNWADYGAPYDTEDEAKNEIKRVKRELTIAWKKYDAYQEAVAKSGGAPIKDVPFAPIPSYRKDAFETMEIYTRGVLANRRLGAPYFVAFTKNHTLEVYNFTASDLYQNDWKLA